MPHDTKIATCSYCGRRQTLQLSARGGHELACGACGAPLHEMKWLKQRDPDTSVKRSPPRPAPHGHDMRSQKDRDRDDPRRRRKKRRKPLWKKAFEEAFDVIEDIFD
jgi:hypothetical protein